MVMAKSAWMNAWPFPRDKKKIAKDCKYWDADGNGVITEDEYVKQVLKIMR